MREAVETNPKKVYNLLTFDLEEWFHILDLHEWQPAPSEWHSLPSRFESNTERILELLSRRGIYGTFFVLGWIGERYPSIIRKIDCLGHEVACHGYGHELLYSLTPSQFRQDLKRAKAALEDITGSTVMGYRGPGFSITSTNLWAFDVIAEEGFHYDATVYPGRHGHGGILSLPSEPFRLVTLAGHTIDEMPASVLSVGGFGFAFSGGGYFRLLPFALITRVIRIFNGRGTPVMVYIHPRDIDPNTPRLPMSLKRRFKCYVNTSSAYSKLEKIIERHAFASIKGWRSNNNRPLETVSLRDKAWT